MHKAVAGISAQVTVLLYLISHLIATQKVSFLISSCEDYTKNIVFLLVTCKLVCYNQTKQKGAIL